MSNLGDMLLKRRTERCESLQDVATVAELTKAHVWELEKGYSQNPSVKTLVGLARALHCSPITLAAAAFSDLPDVADLARRKGKAK